jgi:hypothetical protein
MLELADRVDDFDALIWAADNLLAREWPRDGERIHQETRARLARSEERMRRDGHRSAADRVHALAVGVQQRDLEITAAWGGEADLDLMVIEPGNLLCSPRTPRTTNGGVLVSASISPTEKYVAAEATPGEYEFLVRKVWGSPVGGTASIDVVRYKGTARETRERHNVQIVDGMSQPVKIALTNGRRRSPAFIGPDEIWVVGKPQAQRQAEQPIKQLRRLIATGKIDGKDVAPPVNLGGLGGDGVGNGVAGGFGGAVAFQPIVEIIQDGLSLQVQGIVSADRRYVRLNMVPLIQNLESDNPRQVQVQGAVGGGLFGGT